MSAAPSPIRAILVDDEVHCIKTLRHELTRGHRDVEVIAEYTDSEEGLAGAREHRPDLLFLDVEMPKLDGFELLGRLCEDVDHPPLVVFTTAYESFAVEAFKVNAVDYLVKPVAAEELARTMDKVRQRILEGSPGDPVASLLEDIRTTLDRGHRRVALPTGEGIEYVPTDSLIYCQSKGSYTRIVCEGRPELLISRNLKYVSELLPEDQFLRVHNSYLVATDRISKFVRQDGGYLVMDNGDSVSVSRNRRGLFVG